MSFWTYPAVIISVYTYKYISERKFKSEIKKCLDSAPIITGSEKDVFISVYGYERGKSKATKSGYHECMDRCYIALSGRLRDRFHEDTERELNEFLRHIAKYNNKMFEVCVEAKRINGIKNQNIN